MELALPALESYLTQRFGAPVEILALHQLGDEVDEGAGPAQHLKTCGYGCPILVRYRSAGREHRAVLHTAAANHFGHELRADRAASLLLSYDTFNDLPQHVRALDVGVLMPNHHLRSLSNGDEFFLLTEYAEGTPYAHDLQRLRDGGALTDLDVERARCLARYLAEIHAHTCDDPPLYVRRLRDLLGSGEGIMGLTDSYPSDFALADAARLARIECACVAWRWRLKQGTQRLAQVHGDFHPFNILFGDATAFRLLDRSRGAWGEPADDLTALAINYLFFSLQRAHALVSPFAELWHAFWETYLERSGDRAVLGVVAPFFAWRALVVASPLWYNVAQDVRRMMLCFAERVLAEPVFDPHCVESYLCD